MSLVSRQMLREPGLAAALEPGESALEYVSLKPTGQGAQRDVPVGATVAPPRRESVGREVGGFLAGNWVPRWARGDAIERMIGGVARQGVPGSTGARLHDTSDTATALVVTGHRLVAVSQASITDATFDERWSAELADVIAARRRGRLVGRGRVELYFRDSSMCAVVVGVLKTEGARRLLAALNVPGEPQREGTT